MKKRSKENAWTRFCIIYLSPILHHLSSSIVQDTLFPKHPLHLLHFSVSLQIYIGIVTQNHMPLKWSLAIVRRKKVNWILTSISELNKGDILLSFQFFSLHSWEGWKTFQRYCFHIYIFKKELLVLCLFLTSRGTMLWVVYGLEALHETGLLCSLHSINRGHC